MLFPSHGSLVPTKNKVAETGWDYPPRPPGLGVPAKNAPIKRRFMALNNEFKGTTKQALASLGEYIREFKNDFKDYYKKNDEDHREIFIALGKIEGRRIPLKWLIGLGGSLIASITAIAIAVLNG